MTRNIVAFAAGVLFSAGLCVSGMTQPAKVLAFLDVTGRWDPSLAAVMVGAISVAAVAFRMGTKRTEPILGDRFRVPPAGGPLRLRIVVGAALFGIGWGLSGLCPGPAITTLASGQLRALVFVASMLVGMAIQGVVHSQ
jgi:uncharacterized membrane protein YedE/YeeE